MTTPGTVGATDVCGAATAVVAAGTYVNIKFYSKNESRFMKLNQLGWTHINNFHKTNTAYMYKLTGG